MRRKVLRCYLFSIVLYLCGLATYATPVNLHYDGINHEYTYDAISLYVDGTMVNTNEMEMPPIQLKGYVLVPAREIFTIVGASVEWRASEQNVYVDDGNTLIVLTINSDEVWVNGEIRKLDMSAKVINNKVMIPVRFISETLGFEVSWLSRDRIINIEKKTDNGMQALGSSDENRSNIVEDSNENQDEISDNSTIELNGSKIIVVDPGHGSLYSVGTVYGDILEKDITIKLGNRLTELLRATPNIIVYETRSDDTYVGLSERAAFSNEKNADLFISIHINSATDTPKASGTETYCYDLLDDKSRTFAELVQKALVNEFGTVDRGVKEEDFIVLAQNSRPAVLIEIAFLSNETDRKMMLQADFVERYANTVFKCILEYCFEV